MTFGLALSMAVTLGACTSSDATVDGIVVDIDSEGLGRMRSFTLRTSEGELLTFDVSGPVDLSGDAFPPDHLQQHMALGEGIAVAYEMRDGQRVATRLVDAAWLDRRAAP